MTKRLSCAILVLFAVAACTRLHAAEAPAGRILVVYNNIAGKSAPNLELAGGFAAWIEYGDKVILFDSGGDDKTLAANLKLAKLDAARITALVISHEHWDHTGGMSLLAGRSLDVFVPAKAKREWIGRMAGFTLNPVEGARQIIPGVWTTGQMQGEYKGAPIAEQALIIEQQDGIAVLTGCAHVGIIDFIKTAKNMFPQKKIKLVAGGFHLRDLTMDKVKAISDVCRALGIEKVGPTHCTGDAAIECFRSEWRDAFVPFHLGDQYTF